MHRYLYRILLMVCILLFLVLDDNYKSKMHKIRGHQRQLLQSSNNPLNGAIHSEIGELSQQSIEPTFQETTTKSTDIGDEISTSQVEQVPLGT